MAVTLTINGTKRTFDVPPEMPLLWLLRDVAGLTGTKFGCAAGLCGACSVLVDGVRMFGCWARRWSPRGTRLMWCNAAIASRARSSPPPRC